MQDLSYDTRDPQFTFRDVTFSVQVFTYENLYGLDPAHCQVTVTADRFALHCDQLTWAGGQEHSPGWLRLEANAEGEAIRFSLAAGCDQVIRCIKLVLHEIEPGVIVGLRETAERPIPTEGLILRYPDGWRGLHTPLLALRNESGSVRSFRSLDTTVREKRFALQHINGKLQVELIFEELVAAQGLTITAAPWEIARHESFSEVATVHQAHVERTYGLIPWEQRPDVPGWARQIALVAAIHCQHWSGYVFNSYADVLARLQWLGERIDPTRILAYLPGWEGRYYWQYGDYRPDQRMGGEAGFAALVQGAHRLGARVMPMFGLNYANRGLPNFEQWGEPARFGSAGGYGHGASVDWDGARHFDHGWGAMLNPGAPTWQNRLVTQIRGLVERYELDGVFLDISAAWWNAPQHNVHEGTRRLIARLREGNPELLVAGEGWYDGVGASTPLMQSGHTDGKLHWHDEPFAPAFDTYHRCFGHLCLGDPGRGSSGVHEQGINPFVRVPLRRGLIPTLTIVENSLQVAPAAAEAVIADAHAYAERYLKPM
jgi:hypothetical protein